MKRRVFPGPDDAGGQALVCVADDEITLAFRSALWATWGPPLTAVRVDDDPPEGVRRERRYLAGKDPVAMANLVALQVVEALKQTHAAGVPLTMLADALSQIGQDQFPDGLWWEVNGTNSVL